MVVNLTELRTRASKPRGDTCRGSHWNHLILDGFSVPSGHAPDGDLKKLPKTPSIRSKQVQKEKCRSVKVQANAIMGICKWGG